MLFFPGTRPDQYAKGLDSGADVVCLDLEDAVGQADKERARDQAVELLGGGTWLAARSAVRINRVRSDPGRRDLEALARAADRGPDIEGAGARGAGAMTVLLPKVDGPGEVEEAVALFADTDHDVRIVAMIETALGLEHAMEVASAPGVVALFIGAVDLAVELGCAFEWEPLLYARSRVVHASAVAGVQAIDVPFLDLRDREGLVAEARAVARLGFTGKAAIHPGQIEPIHEAFAPTPAELERAHGILEAHAHGTGGVTVFEGRMIDGPVLEAARRTIARASEEKR
ncbi:MAG: CoA ester lyase [Gemmatimonadota bacterium]